MTRQWVDSDESIPPPDVRVQVEDRDGETGVGVFRGEPYLLHAETWRTSPGLTLHKGYRWRCEAAGEARQMPIDDAVAALREIAGGRFDGIDAVAYVRELRGDGTSGCDQSAGEGGR